MDNYSPSHPTDETEAGGDGETSIQSRTSKTFNNEFDGVFKKLVSQIVEVKKAENESEKKLRGRDDKGQNERESSDERSHKRSSVERRRSDKRRRSTEKRSSSRGRRGGSRGKRGRSRSRERRSRSRNRSGKRDSWVLKESRHSSDRRNERSQRSPDAHSVRKPKSKSKSPFNKEFRQNIRRRDKNQSPEVNSFRRSKSPPNKDLFTSNDRRNEKTKRQFSPNKLPWNTSDDNTECNKEQNISMDRDSDNIFSKLTELRTLPITDVVKEKWGYDSDEEVITKPVPTAQDFSNNRGGFQNHDDRTFRGRLDFGDRRGRGSFRGFQRDSQWGHDRNDSFSNQDVRNQPWSQNRNESFNQRDAKRTTFEQIGQDTAFKHCSQKEAVEQNKHEDITANEIKSMEEVLPVVNKSPGAENSDDEFGAWSKKDCEVSQHNIPQSDSRQPIIINESQKWGPDTIKNDDNKSWPKNNSQLDSRENIEGGFAAWKNAQKVDTPKRTEAVTSDKFADESDEEFGNWSKKRDVDVNSPMSIKDNVEKETVTKVVNEDSEDEFGAWGNERKMSSSKKNDDFPVENQQNEIPFQSERPPFQNRNNFSNSSFNNNSNNSFNNNNNQFGQRRGGPRNFNGGNRFQRPPIQDRSLTNNQDRPFSNNQDRPFSNNQDRPFSNNQDRPFSNNQDRPFSNNQDRPFSNNQDRPFINIQDRPFTNNQNNNFPANYNMNFNNAPPMQLQDVPPLRPFNYNQSQWNMPPQQITNISYPPIVGGKLPFALDTSICPPMGIVPQMQHPMMQQMAFIPPPPPNATIENRVPPMPPIPMMVPQDSNILQQVNRSRQVISTEQVNSINQPLCNIAQSLNLMDNGNLLEKLMTQAGLSSDSLRLAQEKKQDLKSRSVGDTFSTILKSAATSVISRLVESSQKPLISDNMSMSPPSPPSNSPPIQFKHNAKSLAGFVPPPLPNYSDVLKPSINKIINNVKPSENTVFEEKRNRSDFESKNDWQERVALEVKTFLKPAYMSRSIDKNDYKEIMKRCVTKITRSGVTEINREKIEKFVLSYVDKYNKNRKTRQHSAVSSSEHDV